MDAISILTVFSLLMLLGLVLTLISSKLRISNVLVLILSGLFLGSLVERFGFVDVSGTALVTIAILSLVVIVFDGSSRFSAKSLSDSGFSTLRLIGWFIFFNLLVVTPFVVLLFFDGFSLVNVLYSSVFSVIMAATDPATLFVMFRDKSNKIVDFLKIEAVLNTPITILIPFLLLDLLGYVGSAVALFEFYLVGFLTQIVVGIGSGIVVGILFFKAMKHFYSDQVSPLAIITSALISFILAENLGGSGVLSVAVSGFVFGSVYVAHKDLLQEFSGMLSNSLEILVFLLLGFIVNLEISFLYFFKALFVFFLIVVSRYLSVTLSLRDFSKKERYFIALNMPKGLGTAVLVFSLSVMGVGGLDLVVNLVVLVMIISLVVSTFVNFYSQRFTRVKVGD